MFRPIENGRPHAIKEAVFAVRLSRPLDTEQVSAITDLGKARWSSALPQINEIQLGLPVNIPGVAIPGIPTGTAVAFQSIKKNGELWWRVLAFQDQIIVNCLDYEGWEVVWPIARDYLARSVETVGGAETGVSGITLQYINAFEWSGDRPTNKEALFRKSTARVPPHFWDRVSDEWHLHQGWFDEVEFPISGRVLSREHLTAQVDSRGNVSVTLDLLKKHDFFQALPDVKAFIAPAGSMDVAFASARRLIRTALREYLTDEILDMIRAVSLERQ